MTRKQFLRNGSMNNTKNESTDSTELILNQTTWVGGSKKEEKRTKKKKTSTLLDKITRA